MINPLIRQRTRLYTVTGVFCAVTGLLILLLRFELGGLTNKPAGAYILPAVVIFLVGIGNLLFSYLKGDYSAERQGLGSSSGAVPVDMRMTDRLLARVQDSMMGMEDRIVRLSDRVEDLGNMWRERTAARPPDSAVDRAGYSIDAVTVRELGPGAANSLDNSAAVKMPPSQDVRPLQREITKVYDLAAKTYGSMNELSEKVAAAEGSPFTLNEEARHEIISALQLRIDDVLKDDLLVAIEEKYGSLIRRSEYLADLRRSFQAVKSRLEIEIAALSRRGNLNLTIGSLTTMAAVSLLAYIVLRADLVVEDWESVMPSYVLRLSLVIFVEVFSFFFLKLYRSSLHEIKYFHNELTNLDLKFIALESALIANDPEAAKAIIQELGRTERNFVLKSGETTLEIERFRDDTQRIKDALQSLSSVVPGRSGPRS
jgi:hypothetical protein